MLTPATDIDRAADTVRLDSTNFSLSAGLPEWSPVDVVVVVDMVSSAGAVRAVRCGRILAHRGRPATGPWTLVVDARSRDPGGMRPEGVESWDV